MNEDDTPRPAEWRAKGEVLFRGALIAFAASLPVTIALAQVFGFFSLLLWGVLRVRSSDSSPEPPQPLAFPILCFLAWALIASALGENPSVSFGRSHRLLMYLLPLAIPYAARRAPEGAHAFVQRLIRAFLFGALILGIYDGVRVPLHAARGAWLYGLGNMRDPQLHLVALLLLISAGGPAAIWGASPATPLPEVADGKRWRTRFVALARTRGAFAVRTLLAGVGLLLHFKRGVWFAFLLSLPVPLAAFRRWRSMLIAGGAVALLLCAPPVRQRLAHLEWEWNTRRGGRRDLWTQVAPAIIRDHPLGFGPRAIRHEDLLAYSPPRRPVEPGLSHLHNNLLHMTAEFGWPGTACWIGWMSVAVVIMLRRLRQARLGSGEQRLAAGILAAFIGLHLNGLVEYNFGNSVVMMLYMLLMGMALSLAPPRPSPAP